MKNIFELNNSDLAFVSGGKSKKRKPAAPTATVVEEQPKQGWMSWGWSWTKWGWNTFVPSMNTILTLANTVGIAILLLDKAGFFNKPNEGQFNAGSHNK